MAVKVLAIVMAALLAGGCGTLKEADTSYEGSPELGIVFMQDGHQMEQRSVGSIGTVRLAAGQPFVILVPQTKRPVQICASDREVIFSQSKIVKAPPCFAGGTGMAVERADPAEGFPLQLSVGDAHNYFDLSRTVGDGAYRAVHIKAIEGEAPARRIYLIVFLDQNGNRRVDEHESENFVLEFGSNAVSVKQGRQATRRSDSEIQAVMANNADHLYAVYTRALRTRPELEGKIMLRSTILPSGKIADLDVVSSTLQDPEFVRDFVADFGSIDFGSKDVPASKVMYPITFTPAKE